MPTPPPARSADALLRRSLLSASRGREGAGDPAWLALAARLALAASGKLAGEAARVMLAGKPPTSRKP